MGVYYNRDTRLERLSFAETGSVYRNDAFPYLYRCFCMNALTMLLSLPVLGIERILRACSSRYACLGVRRSVSTLLASSTNSIA